MKILSHKIINMKLLIFLKRILTCLISWQDRHYGLYEKIEGLFNGIKCYLEIWK
jgi:hypothetical protein